MCCAYATLRQKKPLSVHPTITRRSRPGHDECPELSEEYNENR